MPLITVAASDKMQSRVAAGLTTAAGFPELVVHSLQQYEDAVVSLGGETGRHRLKATRNRMLNARNSSPYFDSLQWVRCFEIALKKAWSQRRRRKPNGLLRNVLVDPQSCHTAASMENVAIFTPTPVLERIRGETLPITGDPEDDVSGSIPAPAQLSSLTEMYWAAKLSPGTQCSTDLDCKMDCKSRCCNAKGSTLGCTECDQVLLNKLS